MSFVIDASSTLPWRFEDEATPWTDALLDRVAKGEKVFVPCHWPLEVANGLLTALRRGRVTSKQIQEFVDDLATFPLKLQPPSNPTHAHPRHHLRLLSHRPKSDLRNNPTYPRPSVFICG